MSSKKGARRPICPAPSRKGRAPLALLLTGVPGTGKTSLAQAFCKKSGWACLSLNDLVKQKKLYSRIDKKDGAKVAKLKELEREANRFIQSSSAPVLLEGHLGCEIKLAVSCVLVLRLHPDELRRRLGKRRYSAFKLEENLMAEMLDYCTLRAQAQYGKGRVFEMDGSKRTLAQNLRRFARFMGACLPPGPRAASGSSPRASKPALASFSPTVSWARELARHV